jgi:hypothetical protein
MKTTKANYESMLHSIEPSSLPATIGDAIVFTRKLGFRYLWVDSLCIVQPERKGDSHDQRDWEEELPNMCRYYKHASATLIIESAAGDEEGFLASLSQNPNFRPARNPIIFPIQMDGITGYIEIERGSYPALRWEKTEITPHQQRAWTLQ